MFQGASLASILLLMALGLAIVFGLMGVINMAHGELMALGAYSDLRRAELVPRALARALRRLLPGGAAACRSWWRPWSGVVLERGVIRRLYGRPLETLLLTWGASLIIQQGLRLWFGAANVDVSSPRWLSGGLPLMVGLHAAVQPALHHRARRRQRGRHVLAAVPHGRRAAHPRGHAEPRR